MKHTADAIELASIFPKFFLQNWFSKRQVGIKQDFSHREINRKPSGMGCEGLKKLELNCEGREGKNCNCSTAVERRLSSPAENYKLKSVNQRIIWKCTT